MTTGIICASDDELAPFLSFMEEFSVVRKSMLKIYRGKIAGRSVAALYGGVGKINAAAATQLLADKFRCDAIINAGTAGALSDALKPFDTVAVVKTACYDADEDLITQYHPFLPSIWLGADEKLVERAEKAAQTFPSKVYFGAAVTGDHFISDDRTRRDLARTFNALCVDMESAAVAQVCRVNKIPFIAVRTISDCADGESKNLFDANSESAAAVAARFVLTLL